jgi:uncharacterized membrane protein (UPF0127 family)
VSLWLLLVAGCTPRGEQASPVGPSPAAAPAYTLSIGGVGLLVEVAATEEARERGLSGRAEVPSGTGMLFVFPDEAVRSFWMKDTLVPLSVAFLDREGRITQMEDMTPLSEEAHRSREPARYVLEVPQGWFTKMGITVGDQVVFGETLRRRLQKQAVGEGP